MTSIIETQTNTHRSLKDIKVWLLHPTEYKLHDARNKFLKTITPIIENNLYAFLHQTKKFFNDNKSKNPQLFVLNDHYNGYRVDGTKTMLLNYDLTINFKGGFNFRWTTQQIQNSQITIQEKRIQSIKRHLMVSQRIINNDGELPEFKIIEDMKQQTTSFQQATSILEFTKSIYHS